MYGKWTEEDELRLEEAQSDVVEMAHTALTWTDGSTEEEGVGVGGTCNVGGGVQPIGIGLK